MAGIVSAINSATGFTPPAAQNYSYSPNGSGGVNYFLNGKPITNTQYGQGTGQDYKSIEANVAKQYAANSSGGSSSTSSSTGGSSSGSTGASSTLDPAAAALYNAQVGTYQGQLGTLDGGLLTALSNIDSGYNDAVNKEGQAFGQATQQYNNTKANDQTNEDQARNQIIQNVNQQTAGIQRLLGLAGSGNSSASEIAAPYLINQQGAQANNANETSYGQNEQALDTSFNAAKLQDQNTLATLAQQKFANEQAARGSENSQKATLLQSLIGAIGNRGSAAGESQSQVASEINPYLSQINDAVKAAAGYSSQYATPVYQTTQTAYTPPSLSTYVQGLTTAPTTATAASNTAANNVTVAPTAQKQNSVLTTA